MKDFVLILTHHNQTYVGEFRLVADISRTPPQGLVQILVRAKTPHIDNRAMARLRCSAIEDTRSAADHR